MVCSYFYILFTLADCHGDECLRRLHHMCQGECEWAKGEVYVSSEKRLCRVCVNDIIHESVGKGKDLCKPQGKRREGQQCHE